MNARNTQEQAGVVAEDEFAGDGTTPLDDVAQEGSADAVETGIFNPGSGSTGNAILDMSIGSTAGVTPSIDTLLGMAEGDGYTEPADAPDDDDDEEKA